MTHIAEEQRDPTLSKLEDEDQHIRAIACMYVHGYMLVHTHEEEEEFCPFYPVATWTFVADPTLSTPSKCFSG